METRQGAGGEVKERPAPATRETRSPVLALPCHIAVRWTTRVVCITGIHFPAVTRESRAYSCNLGDGCLTSLRHPSPRSHERSEFLSPTIRLPYLTNEICNDPAMSDVASRYGPHDPTSVPATGRRFGPGHRTGKRTDVETIPLAPILVRQREQLNRIARGEPLVGLRSELCAVCSHPEWQCLSMRRGLDDPHEYEPPRRGR